MISVDNITFLRPINFILRVDSAEFADVFFYCQSATLPGLTVGPASNVRVGKAKVSLAGDAVEYDPLVVTFLVDENMRNFVSIHNWIFNQINSEEYFNKDMTLFIQDSNNNISNTIKYFGALPFNLTPLEFDLKNTTIQYMTASISFSFDYYEIYTGGNL